MSNTDTPAETVTESPAEIAADLEARDDVVRAVATWSSCDVAVLVENGTDIGPIRRGLVVVEIMQCDAAPYVVLQLDLPAEAR